VLECVVLGLGKDVQAQNGFEQRRVREGDDALLFLAELEADCDLRTFECGAPPVNLDGSDLLSGESVDSDLPRHRP
jgi:hypothetical protein